ncbi:MAG: translocation/assembly module TamB domain-containing protein, partial [Rubritalea sp.]|uniref:translocation/assembly module TamB domain-containing protein n=1 Tax=Rubritalea sp. TaxID=2109375 RepID=UPI0032427F52
ESLFYKDIDILPIGVPSSAVSDVELPAFDSKNFKVPIPEPFDKWKLDLKVQMEDPLLIRGNIAGGQIEGGFKATGTLAEPALDGTIYAKDVIAKLPFSTLKIHKGEIKFHPRNGLIPTLDIQGKSVVSNYDTSIFVYGLATDPKTTFTSFPPLAKNDIMTLLATGVTAQGLSNNSQAATLRALQLFLAKIKQESGQSRSTKLLEVILSSIDDFEFNINETNGFTGRKFSSAKIKLNPRIYITAQVDEEKQTRGLVVFVLKFR